jgi:Ion channel/Pentapeptide repeats (8 copies)
MVRATNMEIGIMANEEQLAILSRGVEAWNEWRLENPAASIDFRRANLRNKQLENANLAHADLTEAELSFAQLKNANLVFAKMEHAVISFANLEGANLSAASVEDAHLEDANLNNTILTGASFKNASLSNSSLKSASMIDAHLEGANLTAVNLDSANLSSVSFDEKILGKLLRETGFSFKKIWKRRNDLLLDTTVRCKGVNATTCYGSQRFKLFLQDQDFLEEFLETEWGKKIFIIWWLFADCGRSLSRWAGWSLLLALSFAFIYWTLGPNSFNTQHLDFNLITLFYYSVVTFTTLGFGDIIPKTTTAAMWVTVEVILGYIMLGGLITIFASKLSRRGG